jgi:hypothetical protein
MPMTETEFNERRDRAFDPAYKPEPIEQTPSGHLNSSHIEVLAALDDLENFKVLDPIAPLFSLDDLEAVRAEAEVVPVIYEYVSRYDRAFIQVRELEAELENANEGSARYHEVMGQLASAKGRMKIELQNSTDDNFRKFEVNDEWKLTTGKQERNQSRRDREEPNQMTSKEVLANETPEEKKERMRTDNTERKRKERAKKKTLKAQSKTV